MRISDWSSDVCSSDLRSPPASAPTGASSTRSSRAGLDPPPADAAGRRPALRLHGPPGATPGTGAQPVPGKRHAVHDPEAGRSTPAFALEQHRSEEHTSELQSLMRTSYAVFCLKKKKTHKHNTTN